MATTWAVGEYPLMAQRLKAAARRTVDLARVAPGDRVLDIACGTGNAALMAAARDAMVVGVDFEPALLAIARQRAIELDVGVQWVEGDAEALPAGDGAFDAVVSVFGIMYAADQARAAAELARVCAPGARVVLANWTPDGFTSALGAALAPFLPPPVPGPSAPPTRWGDPAAAGELLVRAGLAAGDALAEQVALDFGDRLSAVAFLVRTAGHVVAERPRLEAEGRWPQLLAALAALVTERGEHRGGGVTLRLDYLVVTASAPTPARA
jgi:SAM-dependent methyltransferase